MRNPAWADELSQRLRAAGLPASVLKPTRSDEPHRVVLGPYPTREQAEEAGRKIGMPSFVVTTEVVFSRPGLGKMMVGAMLQRDYTALQSIMVVYTVFVVVINLTVDVVYGLVDPRVRHT